MNEPDPTQPHPPGSDGDHPCELCGRYDAVAIGNRFLCIDCYAGCGSCCQESTMEENEPDQSRKA